MRSLYLFVILLLVFSCKQSDPKSDQKSLLTFGFTKNANPALSADVSGTISGQQVTLTLPSGTNAGALKATFSASPLASVTVNGARQENGVTPNDFTRPVTYRVTAEDGSTADYTVTVSVTRSNARELLSFQFLKTANASLTDDVAVPLTASKTTYLVTLPTGAVPSALKATFTASPGATVTVNGAAQTSSATAPDFSKPVTYRVTAENGEFREYTVETSVQVDLPALENAVKAFMSKYDLPGMSIAITKDERLVYAKAYGMANREQGTPVTNASMFRMGSMSKSITGIAAMKLVDEGKLDLDQRVFGVGGILGKTYGTKPYTPQLEQITVRQLLNHTAGGDAWNHLWDYPTRIDPFYQPEWIGFTQAEVLSATVDNRPVVQTPGTKMVYSNVGSCFAGRVIEKVAGMNYEKYVQEAVLKPLGIPAASMRIAKGSQAGRAPNEVTYYNPYPGYDQPYAFPIERMDAQGAWASTAVHMARLMVHTDGFPLKKDILTKKSVQEMLTPSAVSVAQNPSWGYGLGWFVSPQTGTSTHDGGLAGSSATWWRLSTGYSWVVLVNTRRGEPSYYPDLETFLNTALFSGNPLTANSLMKGDQFEVFYK
jgi:CubicO group peptidase (beta-lactamase class C family)